ncbi:hypothetical protein U1Q18_043236, partial [Sarracenia purpurea var. burkii]
QLYHYLALWCNAIFDRFMYPVKQKALVIWSEHDNIISTKLAMRLHGELPNSTIRQIPDCGHLPHVEKPNVVAELIADFARGDSP